jgi:hypothetical protein
LNPPLYVDQEGNITIQYNETLVQTSQGLGVNPGGLISKDSGNRLELGDDGKLFTKGGGSEGDLGGRVSNAIDTFEVNNIDFENIPKGYISEPVVTPALSAVVSQAFGTEGIFTYKMNTTNATNNNNAYLLTKNSRWEADTGLGSPAVGFNIEYCFEKAFHATKLYWRHGDAGTANNNMLSCDLAYSDDGLSWTTFQSVTTNTNALGTYFTFDFNPEVVKQNGAHRYWSCRNIQMYENSSSFNCNLIQWSGEAYTVTDTTSLGYVAVGDLQITDNGRYVTGFNTSSYLLNKYLVGDWQSYDFRITQNFAQVTTQEPIISFPNAEQGLYIQDGKLHLLRNKVEYTGNLTYTYNQYYFFRILFDSKVGYTIQVSTDNLNWTTEIYLNDESNFIRNRTMYLGCKASDIEFLGTSGTIDLANTGFRTIDGERQLWTYPINSPCNVDCSIIQVTFEGNGLMADGRTAGNLLDNKEWQVNTKNNTILYSEGNSTLAFDESDGLICVNYEEYDYAQDNDSMEDQLTVYEKDVNKTFKLGILYPNFFQRGLQYEIKDTQYKDENITPTLSSNDQDGFVVSDARGNADIYSVFNGVQSKQIGAWNTYWIQQEFPTRFMSRSYSIKADSLGSAEYPTAWRYEGSNDGSKWTIIDNRAGELFTLGQEKTYTFENINSFKYYRLLFLSGVEASGNGEIGRVQFFGTLINPETDTETIVIDFSNPEAVFAPNKFLTTNGFDFTLNLNFTGNLALTRKFDYSLYNQTSPYTTYVNQLGCAWETFKQYVDDPTLAVPNGVQFSSYYGSPFNLTALNTADGIGNISVIGTGANTYANPNATNTTNPQCPGFIYFVFNNPVQFTNFLTTNWSDVAYSNNSYSIDVSNDFESWVSIIPKTASGYKNNLGELPIPSMPTPNSTVNATYIVDLDFPANGFYKYARLGLYNNNGTNRAIARGLWLGGNNAIIANSETLRELILDDIPFLNDGEDGINLDIVKKEDYIVYQVKFEDQLGYVKIKGNQNTLVPEDTPIYADINCTQQISTMVPAYELHCQQWLRNYIDQSLSNGILGNAMSTKTEGEYIPVIMMDSTTGAVANAWNAFWDTATAFDFANGTARTNFIMRFHERCIVEQINFRNYNGASYSPEQIWIEGSNDAYESETPTWENVLGYDGYTMRGTIHIDENGVASGFAASNCLVTSNIFSPASNSWKIKIAVTTGNDITTNQFIIGSERYGYGSCEVNLSGSHFNLAVASTGTALIGSSAGTYTVSANTKYYLEIAFDGTKYTLSYSLDGEEYTTDITITNSTLVHGLDVFSFGLNGDGNNYPWLGTIDLSNTVITIGNEIFWQYGMRNYPDYYDNFITIARGTYSIKLRTDKSYSYYRVGMQRSNNRILMEMVRPQGVWIDPVNKQTRSVLTWKDDFTEIGNNRPIRHMTYPVTSSDSVIPVDNSVIGVASPIRGTTAWNVTQFSDGLWDTIAANAHNARWFPFWQFAPYPFRIAMWQQFTHSDVNYIPENFEIYGTNFNDGFADISINEKYHRLTNLKTTADFATSLLSNQVVNAYFETYFTDNTSHVGYRYNQMLFNKLRTRYPVIREMNLYKYTNTNTIIPMYYTHEWKWTNVYGEKDTVHKLAAYDDPFLIPGTSSAVTPAYRVTYNGLVRWVPTEGVAEDFLPNGYTDIYSNWSLVGNKTPKNIWAYELRYTDSTGVLQSAYIPTEGAVGDFLPNNTIIFEDMDFNSPKTLEYAYECIYNEQTGYVKVSGETGTYAPEGTTVYSDPEFTTVLGTALVDNWAYDGVIHKKYQYTGNIEKKWQYTGDVDNQYVFTGNVEGWKYTGKSEIVHDEVPNVLVRFNRPDTRQVTKQIQVGVSYPIASETDPNTIIGWLYDISGTVGNYCPIGLDYYSDSQNNQVAGTTDGTQVFQSALGTNRYTYDHKFLPNTGEADGVMIGSGQIMYYDANLTEPTDPVEIDSTGYYWDTPTFTSELGSVSFPIPEATGTGKIYNVTNHGTISNKDGVLSGFSQANFVSVPQWKTPSTSMELVIKCNSTSFATVRRDLWNTTVDKTGIVLGCAVDTAQLTVWLSSNNTAWDIASGYNPGLALTLNTDYFVKVSWNGTQYDFAISTDGESWQSGTPIINSNPVFFDSPTSQSIGGTARENTPWSGTIDLNECYLNIDGNRFWSGVTTTGLIENKSLQVSYDSEKYSVTYDGTTQEVVSGEYVKNSVFQFASQELVKLNLSNSLFSWWSWNGLISSDVEKTQQWLFRIANVEGSPGNIDRISPLFPWKVGDGGNGSLVYTYDSTKDKFVSKQGLTVIPTSMLTNDFTPEEAQLPKNTAFVYGIPEFYWGYSYTNTATFTGSRTFSNGGVLYITSPSSVTIQQSNNAGITFSGISGVLPVPPKTTVTSTATITYSEN